MKPISATHVDSDGLVQPSRQIPAAITAHKFLDNADRIFTQPGPEGDIAVLCDAVSLMLQNRGQNVFIE
jgi:hypothetical protein